MPLEKRKNYSKRLATKKKPIGKLVAVKKSTAVEIANAFCHEIIDLAEDFITL